MAGVRILVADDDEASRRFFADVLEMLGYQVHTAPDGGNAWMLLHQSGFSYDLVVTDFMMPAMNGLELLTKVRADSPWIKVILITGRFDPDFKSKAQTLGAFAVLSKPCDVEQLKGTVELALAQ